MFPSTSAPWEILLGSSWLIDKSPAVTRGRPQAGNPGEANGDYAELGTQADF